MRVVGRCLLLEALERVTSDALSPVSPSAVVGEVAKGDRFLPVAEVGVLLPLAFGRSRGLYLPPLRLKYSPHLHVHVNKMKNNKNSRNDPSQGDISRAYNDECGMMMMMMKGEIRFNESLTDCRVCVPYRLSSTEGYFQSGN